MFEINLIFYGLSRKLQFSQFVWALSCYELDVFNKFLLIDATDKSKISSDKKRFFIALSLYPLSFFANTPFKILKNDIMKLNSPDMNKFKELSPEVSSDKAVDEEVDTGV